MTQALASSSELSHLNELINEQIQSDHIDVPLLPEVAGKVVRLTQNPDSDAQELASLIQSDQPLAGQVMRVANSALYSPNSSLVSLQQAITRLGMKLIAEIALAASINSKLFNTPGYEEHIHFHIRNSLLSGLWSKEIARACRQNVEAAFITGLLHGIGRPVAIQTILAVSSQANLNCDRETVLSLENTFQRQIGIHVVEQWDMPKIVVDVVRFFDDFEAAGSAKNQTMIAVAGEEFASHFLCEQGTENCITREALIAHPVLAALNLYQDEVLTILEKADAVNSTMESMTN